MLTKQSFHCLFQCSFLSPQMTFENCYVFFSDCHIECPFLVLLWRDPDDIMPLHGTITVNILKIEQLKKIL